MKKRLLQALSAMLLVCGCVTPVFSQAAPTPGQGTPDKRESYLRDIIVEEGETVQEVNCLFCSVLVRGEVKGTVVAVWGNVKIEGRVEGSAVAAGGRIVLSGFGSAEGSVVAVGGRVLSLSRRHAVLGDVKEVPFIYLPGERNWVFPGTLFFVIGNLLFSILYLVAGLMRVEALANALRRRLLLSFVVGAIAMTAMMAAFVWASDLGEYEDQAMAAVSLLWLLLVLPGCAGVSLAVGRRLRRESGVPQAILLGALLLTLLALLPLAGLAIYAIVWAFALGATFVGRFGFARAKSVTVQAASGP